MMMRCIACLALFAPLAVACAQTDANHPQSNTATIRVTTRLVSLDVSVVNKEGKPVSGLDASQFTIYEGKDQQRIRNFEAPSAHVMPQGVAGAALVHSSADLAKIGNAPVNILVFDELNTPFLQIAYARQMMEKYLSRQPEVLPVATLLVAAGDTKFSVLHDYTQSRAELLDAIRHHLPEYATQLERGGVESQVERISQTLGSLEQIADSSRGTPGRKNVIWIGAGSPSLDLTGADARQREQVESVIRTVTARMLAARVTLYTVAAVGLEPPEIAPVGLVDPVDFPPPLSVDGPYADQLDFATFATATGGRVYSGREGLDAEIGEGITEGGEYYTLTYRPTSASNQDKAYRSIHVLMKDPSLRAITRDGYFEGTAPVEMVSTKGQQTTQLGFDLFSSATSTLEYSGLHVTSKPVAGGVFVTISARDLSFSTQDDGSHRTELTVLAAQFDAKAHLLSQKAREIKEGLKADRQIESSTKISFLFPLDFQAKATRVRVVVRDAATGTLGSADSQAAPR